MFSVGDEEEAESLIVLSCPRNAKGQYIAPELVEEQTLENLERFSDRLAERHRVLVEHGHCRCRGGSDA